MFWIGLFVGLFVGASIGFVVACLCAMAGRSGETTGTAHDYDLGIARTLPEVIALVEALELLLKDPADMPEFENDLSWGWSWDELSSQAQEYTVSIHNQARDALAPFEEKTCT